MTRERTRASRDSIEDELPVLDPHDYSFKLPLHFAAIALQARDRGDGERARVYLNLARDTEDEFWRKWPGGPTSIPEPAA